MQFWVCFRTGLPQQSQPAPFCSQAEQMISLTTHPTPWATCLVWIWFASSPSKITMDCTIQTGVKKDKNKNTLERQMEEWKIMARFPKKHSCSPGKQEKESGTCTALCRLTSPLVLFFSLPSVSFPQLQSLPCLCCPYDLTNGNTQLHSLGLVSKL